MTDDDLPPVPEPEHHEEEHHEAEHEGGAGEVVQEHAGGIILHVLGEASHTAFLGLLGLVLDVVQIQGNVTASETSPQPGDDVGFFAACVPFSLLGVGKSDPDYDNPDMRLCNHTRDMPGMVTKPGDYWGAWISPQVETESAAHAKAHEHQAHYKCQWDAIGYYALTRAGQEHRAY